MSFAALSRKSESAGEPKTKADSSRVNAGRSGDLSDKTRVLEQFARPHWSLSTMNIEHPGQPASRTPKLAIGPVNDSFEREADEVAERVAGMAEPGAAATGAVQEKCSFGGACPNCQVGKATGEGESLRLQSAGQHATAGAAAPPMVRQALDSGGQALEAPTRAFMEPRFGRDFSNVRIHTGELAARSAQGISANAYTYNGHIVFAAGKYQPETSAGRRLLAHELTHIVHQGDSEHAHIQRDAVEFAREEIFGAFLDTPIIEFIFAYKGARSATALLSDRNQIHLAIEQNDLEPGFYTLTIDLTSPNGYQLAGEQVVPPEPSSSPKPGAAFSWQPSNAFRAGGQGHQISLEIGSTAEVTVGTPEQRIAALPEHIRSLLTDRSGGLASAGSDPESIAEAGEILAHAGYTADEARLVEQQRRDQLALGKTPEQIADPVQYALKIEAKRRAAAVSATGNRVSLTQSMTRLSTLSRPLLDGIGTLRDLYGFKALPSIQIFGGDSAFAPHSSFVDGADLGATWNAFSTSLESELQNLGLAILNATEAAIYRIDERFTFLYSSSKGNEEFALQAELERLRADKEVLEARQQIRVEEEDARVDLGEDVYGEAEPIHEQHRKSIAQLNNELDALVASKSKLDLTKLRGISADELLSSRNVRSSYVGLQNRVYKAIVSITKARAQFNDHPESVFGADLVIATEKVILGVQHGSSIDWIIDDIALEKQSKKSFWDEILEIAGFVAGFLSGPFGLAIRTGLALVEAGRTVGKAGEQSAFYGAHLSSTDPSVVGSLVFTAAGVAFDMGTTALHGVPGGHGEPTPPAQSHAPAAGDTSAIPHEPDVAPPGGNTPASTRDPDMRGYHGPGDTLGIRPEPGYKPDPLGQKPGETQTAANVPSGDSQAPVDTSATTHDQQVPPVTTETSVADPAVGRKLAAPNPELAPVATDAPPVSETDPRLAQAEERLSTAEGKAAAARGRLQAASEKAAAAEQASALADADVAAARKEAKVARAERDRAKKAYDRAKPGSRAAARAEYNTARNAVEKAESKFASAAKRAKSANKVRGETNKAVPRQAATLGRAEQAVAAAEEQHLIEAEADRIRKLPRNVEGLPPSWDYERFPKGPKRDWMPGDAVNMPDAKGTVPVFATTRKRIWRTLATDELAARAAGRRARVIVPPRPKGPVDPKAFEEIPKGGLPWLDPIPEATDKELAAVAVSGSMPSRLGAEIEHARIRSAPETCWRPPASTRTRHAE